MQRALFADDAVTWIGRFAAQEHLGDLALVWDNDHEHIGGHDRADESADMNEGAASRKHVGEEPGRRYDQGEDDKSEKPHVVAKRRTAEEIVD